MSPWGVRWEAHVNMLADQTGSHFRPPQAKVFPEISPVRCRAKFEAQMRPNARRSIQPPNILDQDVEVKTRAQGCTADISCTRNRSLSLDSSAAAQAPSAGYNHGARGQNL